MRMILLSNAELANLGAREAAALLVEGRLSPVQAWVAVKGAEKYLQAVKEGRVKQEQWADAAAKVCSKCDRRFEREIALKRDMATATYCGVMGKEEFDAAARLRTCGCLVGLTVNGVVHGAAKTVVEGEACPGGYW